VSVALTSRDIATLGMDVMKNEIRLIIAGSQVNASKAVFHLLRESVRIAFTIYQFSLYLTRRQNMKVRTDIRAGDGVEFDLEDEEEFDEDSSGL
jgi:hypothetical protein